MSFIAQIQRWIDEADAAFAGEKAVAVDEGDDGGPDRGGEGCTWEGQEALVGAMGWIRRVQDEVDGIRWLALAGAVRDECLI